MRIRIVFLLCFSLLTAACSTPSALVQECKKANWAGRGDTAGFEGQAKEAAWKSSSAACAEVGVSGDKSDFFEGWQRGNARYCEPRYALVLGRQVREYSSVCNGPQVATWIKAYEHGRLISDVDRDIDRIENELRALQAAKRTDSQTREANLQQLRQTALLRRESLESQAIAQGWGLGR
jgi:hypothetical protein